MVLLILAGITINFVMSDNGIFKTAENSKGKQKEAEYLEQIKIAVANSKINENFKINVTVLENSLNNIEGISIEEEGTEGNLPWTLSTNDGYKFQIKEDGTVEAVSGITLSKTSLNLEQGKSETLTVLFTEGLSGLITWSSSNTNVATVDSTGKVTAVEDGTTTITATVASNGKTHEATCIVTVKVALLEGWEEEKVVAVKSTDNVTVPVPKGFTASTEDGEKSVADGFVIKQDGTNNEFVWVPYNTFKTTYPMFTTRTKGGKTINIGQLYTYNNSAKTSKKITTDNFVGHREPATVRSDGSSYPGDEVATNYKTANIISNKTKQVIKTEAEFEEQLQDEFDEMKESVEKYGGFYIGRYETGNLSQTKAVVAQGNTDINKQTWYPMYQKCKEIVVPSEECKAQSSMIWGCQWDATLNWLVSQGGTKKDYVFYSASKGNYGTSSPIATGHTGYDVNNIFDMAGNVYDWTLEAGSDPYRRVLRGGHYGYDGSSWPASDRVTYRPADSPTYNGSRVSLYVK